MLFLLDAKRCRTEGFCVNVTNTFQIRTKKPLTKKSVAFHYWWAHQDLNLGPKDYESSALTN